MLVIINVGRRKSGKTFLTRNLLQGLRAKGYSDFACYDPNNEYLDYNSLRELPKMKDFNEAAAEKYTDTVIVYEEATIFFRHAADEDVLNLCVRSRHRKGSKGLGNLLIFNFHSLRSVPLYILDHVDYMNIKKTNDNPKNIEVKFKDYPIIFDKYLAAKISKDLHVTETVDFYA